jgi:hypothetical protein
VLLESRSLTSAETGTSAVVADLVELANEWAASEAIVGAQADFDALEEAGIEVHRIADPAQVS